MTRKELEKRLIAFCHDNEFTYSFSSKTTSAFLNVGTDQIDCTIVSYVCKEISSDYAIFFDARCGYLRFIFTYD